MNIYVSLSKQRKAKSTTQLYGYMNICIDNNGIEWNLQFAWEALEDEGSKRCAY